MRLSRWPAHSTRAASERIFNKPRERSSWVAKPSTRVPMGWPFALTSTQAFLWNLTTLPSLRCTSFFVSVITAFCTDPAVTLPALPFTCQHAVVKSSVKEHLHGVSFLSSLIPALALVLQEASLQTNQVIWALLSEALFRKTCAPVPP